MIRFTGNIFSCFELEPSFKEGFNPVKKGSVKIALKFKSALTEAINVIVFFIGQGCMEVDKHKIVTLAG